MAKEKLEKTNAIRILEREKVSYQHRSWSAATKENTGVELAQALGQPPEQVFKTLVTVGKSGNHYVFMLPVAETLHLKKAAAAVGEKAVSMIKEKELLPLTGYVHGGCSPIGIAFFLCRGRKKREVLSIQHNNPYRGGVASAGYSPR